MCPIQCVTYVSGRSRERLSEYSLFINDVEDVSESQRALPKSEVWLLSGSRHGGKDYAIRVRSVGWNAAQQITDPAGLGAQTRTDIVCLRLYIVGEHIHNARSVREALLGFFPAANLPTALGSGFPP